MFSSTTCSACKDFWPLLKDFADKNPKLNIVMISEGTLEEELRMKNQVDFNFLILQADQNIFKNYKVPGTPYLYLLDKNMKIVLAGFSDQLEEVENKIK
jgi:thiol-disulfide isomerase/thioredoxin